MEVRDRWAQTDETFCRDWQDGIIKRPRMTQVVMSVSLKWVTTRLKPIRAKSEIRAGWANRGWWKVRRE